MNQKHTFIKKRTKTKDPMGLEMGTGLELDQTIKPRKISKKFWGLIIGFGLLLTVLITLAVGISVYFSRFEAAAEVSAISMLRLIRAGLQVNPFSATGNVTLAILGTDELDQRNRAPPLTDTIMLITFQKNGHVHVISIPRDLWLEAYKTKVNSLYTLAEQNEPGSGSKVMKNVLGEITGLPIDYLMLIKMSVFKEIVDVMGGIDVNVERSFSDNKYPRSMVDISTQDQTKLFETITFNQGWQHFDGDKALKFIRSRQSEDPQEGTDLARSQRQQLVIKAIMTQLQPNRLVRQITLLGNLYRIYREQVISDLPDPVVIGMGKALSLEKVQVKPMSLPVEANGQGGLLRENPRNKQNQWVLEPIDPTWEDIKTYIFNQIQ